MAINGTLELIDSVTVGAGGAASIEFTNIPQTYDDLVLKLSLRGGLSSFITYGDIRFNGVGTNRGGRLLVGEGSGTPYSVNYTSEFFTVGTGSTATSSVFSSVDMYIPNYRSSSNKTFLMDSVTENNAASAVAHLFSGIWSNASAISSITILAADGSLANNQTWSQHSTAHLYGVTRVPAGAKATGGVISETDTHWVHTFTSSGVFTPLQNIACDYLVVAGGGGGGGVFGGGGGGAGGYRSFTSQSLTSATNYTITIGAGGAGSATNTPAGAKGSNSSFASNSSTGGGGGASNATGGAATIGGSGGGGNQGSAQIAGAAGNEGSYSPVEGFAGGNGAGTGGSYGAGGGGGGASAVGVAASSNSSSFATGGNGGAGSTWLNGTAYAGGGGGGAFGASNLTVGTGGVGGGGNGSTTATASSGTKNTGGGGGGGGSNAAGGAGASGIVIVRYAK